MAGLHKHKWSYTVKYAPDHFGHNIFRPPKRTLTKRWLNVGDLSTILKDVKQNGGIDLGTMGFDKLLGQGTVSERYVLKIPRASTSAIEKIKAAGGSVEVELREEKAEKPSEGKASKGEKTKAAPATAKI
jgi:large subunit ribosomal protein L15